MNLKLGSTSEAYICPSICFLGAKIWLKFKLNPSFSLPQSVIFGPLKAKHSE